MIQKVGVTRWDQVEMIGLVAQLTVLVYFDAVLPVNAVIGFWEGDTQGDDFGHGSPVTDGAE